CSNRGVSVCSCVHGVCDSGLRGSGSCTCFSGYKGPNCDQELPACAALRCEQNSRCMEEALTGQLVCQCLPGYQRSGAQCLCETLTLCCLLQSHCECLPGFDNLLDGGCSLTDSCRPDSCDKNANCSTVGPGRVECTCLQGYLGNGKVCYGNIIQRLTSLNTEPGGQWSGQLSSFVFSDSLSWPLQSLGPFTLFVPINKGFRGTSVRTLTADESKAKYLCKMHLVAGVMPFDTLKKTDVFYTLTGKSAETDTTEGDSQTKIRIHGSRKKGVIVQPDLVASNGMIHIINKLMDSVSPTVESDTQVNTPDQYRTVSDLASVLDRPGPITVFAPSSSAFDAMAEGHLQYLSSAEVRTSQTQVITGQIMVDGAAVLEAAVEAKNGRLYVVDGVLTPPSIQPVLPHRCDITDTQIVKGECVSCSKVKLSQCSSGVFTVRRMRCVSVFVQTPACCKGFHGPDCSPCPGGYQTPCSGHGQCLEGIGGNGSCICDPNFSGSRCQYCSSSNKYGPNCDRTCPCIHGQCDNRPDSDGRCKPDSCLMGFTGRFCDRTTVVCGVPGQFCHAHADCLFSQGTSLLRLLRPLQAKCIKTGPGSHSCQCLTGWREDGDDCQPINNCDGPDRGGCHPNATCIYVGPGQSDCTCKPGYKGNGRDCEAVNQCVTRCVQASCLLLSSRWTCVCGTGYVGNGQICYGTVLQDSGVSLSDQNLTVLVPSSAAVAQMSPEDKHFWTMKGNLPSLISLSNTSSLTSLLKTPLPVSTTNEVSPHQIIHFQLLSFLTNIFIFKNKQYLKTAVLLSVFDPVKNICAFILNHKQDVNTTRYHVVASERLLRTDLQPGGYKQTLLGFSFQLGIYPRDGKLFVNDAQINSSNILSGEGVIHGLSAVLTINWNRCDEIQYQKVMGICVDCLFPQNTICPNNTIPDRRKCMFTRMFEGERLLTIGCKATCLQESIVRRCCGGFFGQHCEPCPGPKGQPCFGNGLCVDGTNGTGACQCHKGFEGTACETCQRGMYGVHCDQDCGCKAGRCNDGLKGDGTCECEVGWRGVLCDETDELCGSAKCGFQCLCAFGFKGNGTFCQAIDACSVANGGCSVYAVCKRTQPGMRECVCSSGYRGDGRVCVEINPCLEGNGGCHANADCVHVGPNKTSCSCSDGYSGDGQNCKMINLCQKVSGRIFINEANVTYSDEVSVNGILHEINRFLFPPAPLWMLLLMNCALMFQDSGVMDLVNDVIYQPVTVFLPSDGIMASLPQEQKDFLFHKDNRPQLVEYLKYHILQSQKIYAEGLIHLDSARTLQGSPLSFSCGGMDDIGEIFVNDGKCRIVQRHLVFNGGMAYGIDCLLTPPSLGGRCDEQTTFDLQVIPIFAYQKQTKDKLKPTNWTNQTYCNNCPTNKTPKCCHGYYGRDCLVCPGGVSSPCSNRGNCDDGHLGNGTCTCNAGFGGVACELCSDGFHGATCKACNCSEHGSCDAGRKGTGSCFCDAGWTGERCETEVLHCSPSCSPKAVCRENNTCVCRPFYEGDGLTCTAADMCKFWNGGCAKGARCSQKGEQVSCTCPKGHSGDGFTCQPMDPCVSGDNGGCHEHATCTMTAPGKKKCTCKNSYIGDGLTCELKQLPISRCLQDNGQCHQDATCTDLHFEDAKLGVFHYRSEKGQYKLNYTAAQHSCTAQGGSLATYNQLSYAQQGGFNMCAAGWLEQARVAYPTTYSNPLCGFGHVGIVDYGIRKNLSETWDTFCYRMKEVKCDCKVGYVGDGFSCTGNLLQVLQSTPTFSNFFTQILNYSQVSESGRLFVKRLGNLTVQSTLFVPDNNGLPDNQTLSQRDIEFHLSEGQALPVIQMKNGSRIRTRVGSLTSSRYINNRFVTTSDVLASNGIIHVLQGPLQAPPPRPEAGMGVGVLLLVMLVAGVVFIGYHFYTHNTKPFQFHYFKVTLQFLLFPPHSFSTVRS
uniref:Stabilin 2 n=1 Tax=Sparus aurata TaxID=8175 RepID=A0A671UAA8_SPAAU